MSFTSHLSLCCSLGDHVVLTGSSSQLCEAHAKLVIIHDSDMEQSRENSESGGFNVPAVLWRDMNYSHCTPTPPLYKRAQRKLQMQRALSQTGFGSRLRCAFNYRWHSSSSGLEPADAKARCFKGSPFLCPLQPPRPSTTTACRIHKPACRWGGGAVSP